MTGIEKTLVIDLETRADREIEFNEAWWDRFRERVEIPGNLKDPLKVAAYPDEAVAKARQKLALSPRTGQIAMIGIDEGDGNGVRVFKHPEGLELTREGEREMLSEFVDEVSSRFTPALIGWNLREFDVPFLIARCTILNVRPPRWMPIPRNYRRVIDLKEILGGALDDWFFLLTGKFKDVNGPEILDVSLEDLESHLIGDVAVTRQLATRTENVWRTNL